MKNRESLSSEELSLIRNGLDSLRKKSVKFTDYPNLFISLYDIEDVPRSTHDQLDFLQDENNFNGAIEMDFLPAQAVPCEEETNWLIGMSDTFIRSIKDFDRKLKGGILEAISIISSQPTVQRGNTVKPLKARFKGLWRYRIGDYRLIYKPDMANKTVLLMSFTNRADAYR